MFADWTHPEAVFEKMQAVSEGRPNDISGIQGYKQLDACGGIQWPWSSEDAAESETVPQQRRLFADGVFCHPDGKAKLIVDELAEMPESPDREYPFLLLSGRGTVSQWHTQTRTSKSKVLRKLYPQRAYIEINPVDAGQMGVANGDSVSVRSRRGMIEVTAALTPTVQPGQAFIPMHYDVTNQLTLRHFDPYSRQPSYKDCAVAIAPSETPD